MTRIILNYPEDDARVLIKAAFKRTQGIKRCHEEGSQIVGKTGFSLTSHGENIYVDISESADEKQTPIEVTAEKEVQINITANAQKYKRRFLDELESLRGESIDDISSKSKKPTNKSNQDDNPSASVGAGVGIVLFIIGLLTIFAGVSMDTTNQATSCYEIDGAYGSSGCVETTYYDPSGQILAIGIGLPAIIFGGYLIFKGETRRPKRAKRF